MNRKIKNLIIFLFIIMAVLTVGKFVLAADSSNLLFGGQATNVASELGLGAQDPRVTAANIIRIALGFLGIIAVGLIMYAGWLYMTAAGNEDNIDTAKKILIGALIGLIIILSSFLIATFILNKLLKATGVPDGTGVIDDGTGGGFDEANTFYVSSTVPRDGDENVIRNAKIRFTFNKSVDPNTVSLGVPEGTFQITDSGDNEIPGTFTISEKRIIFIPSGACPDNPCGSNNCFPENENIKVTAFNGVDGILSVNGLDLNCGVGSDCSINFNTNDVIDCEDPQVRFDFNQICVAPNNIISAEASDDSGVDKVDFFIDGASIYEDINQNADNPFYASTAWDAASHAVGELVSIEAVAYDIDDNNSSINKTVTLRPEHCCSGAQDGDETGIDCGGSCASCAGQACASDEAQPANSCSDDLCSSGFCASTGSTQEACAAAGYGSDISSCCLCQNKPRIDSISPSSLDGAPGNLITINGRNFGNTPGHVYFSDGIEAQSPSTVNASCTDYWGDQEIIVVIPNGAQNGPLKVVAANTFEDTTDNNYGAKFDPFIINTTVRPGICAVNPKSGYFGTDFIAQGVSFSGDNQGVLFGNESSSVTANNIGGWTNSSVAAKIPNIESGNNTVFVKVNGEASNALGMSILYDASNAPVIDYIDPANGPRGQYITIYGSNFKSYDSTVSKVRFYSPTSGETFDADGLDFPEECRDGWWRDTFIAVKVPEGIGDGDLGDYEIRITNQDALTSDKEIFEVTDGPPGPGLCKLDPHNGPAGETIKLIGDNFGNKKTDDFVKFYNNKIVNANSIISWSAENYNISVNVPVDTQTGPVLVSADGKTSNSLPFELGGCTGNDQCYDSEECCLSGSFSGLCKTAGTCGEGEAQSCTFAWTFSTAAGEDENLTCSGISTAQQCLETGSCPNSPGECRTTSDQTIGAGCGDDYCNTTYTQCSGECIYDANLNKCKSSALRCDEKNNTLISGFTAICSASGVWQVNTSGASCPPGTFLDFGGLCTLGTVSSPTSCEKCSAGFSCSANECVINNQVCPSKSTCDLDSASATFKQCRTNDICECCCQVGHDEQDCCPGLTCTAGGCGLDSENYGLCTGCLVEINGVPNQDASNQACNCSGAATRYCDMTKPSGVCADVATEDAPCYDPAVGATCQDSSLPPCGPSLFCDKNNGCTCKPTGGLNDPCGSASDPASCQLDTSCSAGLTCKTSINGCTCQSSGGGNPGDECKFPVPDTCAEGDNSCACTEGADSCKTDYLCKASGSDVCGRCCCNPGDPTLGIAPQINPAGLICFADKSPCGGVNRGLYCGCTSDGQCGDVPASACGSDTCCRARPEVTAEAPAHDSQNICRNAQISATFDQQMDTSSFTGNIIVVGDYNTSVCPAGTEYILAQANGNKGFLSRLYYKGRLALRRVLEPIIPQARALASNYCAIKGTVSGTHNANEKTILTFDPDTLLAGNTTYYVIIKGDNNIEDSIKAGVFSYYDIAMNALNSPIDNNKVFNEITFSNSYIWSFTTMSEQAKNNGVCTIDKIEISPSSYLFKTVKEDLNEDDTNPNAPSFDNIKNPDRDKVFAAKAISSDGQALSKISGIYDWSWSWNPGNTSVVHFENVVGLGDNKQLVEASDKETDGTSIVTAKASVSGTLAAPNEVHEGQAQVWVFVCENPWPPIVHGEWTPWQDTTQGAECLSGSGACYDTHYEIYYCRDAGKPGTYDDLPPILSDSTIIRGSSTASSLLKEFYFLREDVPDVSGGSGFNLSVATSSGVDGKIRVRASWNKIDGAIGYKIYYGTHSASYDNFKEITKGDTLSILVDNLVVGKTYYFAVTAYYSTGAESIYSEEKNIKVEDKTPPAIPDNVHLLNAGSGEVTIAWDSNAYDTTGYKVYYRVGSGAYGAEKDVGLATEVTITGLTNGTTYYFVVIAYDKFGNKSNVSNEISGTPSL